MEIIVKDLLYYKSVNASNRKIIITQGEMLQEKMARIKALEAELIWWKLGIRGN